MQSATRIRLTVACLGFLCKVDYPCGSLVTEFVKVIEMLRHVLVVGMGCAYRIAGLAVLAELADVSVWLEPSVFLG